MQRPPSCSVPPLFERGSRLSVRQGPSPRTRKVVCQGWRTRTLVSRATRGPAHRRRCLLARVGTKFTSLTRRSSRTAPGVPGSAAHLYVRPAPECKGFLHAHCLRSPIVGRRSRSAEVRAGELAMLFAKGGARELRCLAPLAVLVFAGISCSPSSARNSPA